MSVYNINGKKIDSSSGLSDDAKSSLLECFRGVAWVNNNSNDNYYENLRDALYSSSEKHLTVSFNPTREIYNIDTLASIKEFVSVVDETGASIPKGEYTLSGELNVGENTIYVTYGNTSESFVVTALDAFAVSGFNLLSDEVELKNGQSDLSTKYPSNMGWEDKTNRRSLVFTVGKVAFDSANGGKTNNYPIPVKKDANQIKISVTPSTQYIYSRVIKLDKLDAEQYWSVEEGTSWTQGPITIDISSYKNTAYKFLAFNLKYDSNDSSYPTEPSAVTVEYI